MAHQSLVSTGHVMLVAFFAQGLAFAKEHGLVFMETSAKTAANVEEVRMDLCPSQRVWGERFAWQNGLWLSFDSDASFPGLHQHCKGDLQEDTGRSF